MANTIKFADNTTVVGLITDNDETAYREVRDLAVWCQDNNLSLNVSKTKELIMDYRKRRAEHTPGNIDRAVVEWVESFKFHGVHITNKLSWFKHTKTVVKRARQCLSPLRRLKRLGMVPQILKVLQLHHRVHLDRLHHCLVWKLLGIQPYAATDWSEYVPVHHWGQASWLPARTYILGGVRGRPKKLSDSSHPSPRLFSLLPSLHTKGSLLTGSTPKL
jgi:hypothetical protein